MDDETPDHFGYVPDGSELLRVAAEVRDGEDLIAPIPIYDARPGDLVVVSHQQVGEYLGGGKMKLNQSSAE